MKYPLSTPYPRLSKSLWYELNDSDTHTCMAMPPDTAIKMFLMKRLQYYLKVAVVAALLMFPVLSLRSQVGVFVTSKYGSHKHCAVNKPEV